MHQNKQLRARAGSIEETSLWAAYTFQHLIIDHRLIIFLSLSAAYAAARMLITRDSYAEIAERGKQEAWASVFLSFFLFLFYGGMRRRYR